MEGVLQALTKQLLQNTSYTERSAKVLEKTGFQW